jgi:hypothetical protein
MIMYYLLEYKKLYIHGNRSIDNYLPSLDE